MKNLKGRTTVLLTRDNTVKTPWGTKPVDVFMDAHTLSAENVTRKALKLAGAKYLETKNPNISHSSAMMSAGYSVFFAEKNGNLVKTGEMLVA